MWRWIRALAAAALVAGPEVSAQPVSWEERLARAEQALAAAADDRAWSMLSEVARSAPDEGARRRAHLLALSAATRTARFDRAAAVASEVERALGADPDPRLALALGHYLRSRPDGAGETSSERLRRALAAFDAAIAHAGDDAGVRAEALEYRANVRSLLSDPAGALDDLAEAMRLYRAAGAPEAETRCELRIAYTAYVAGDWTGCLDALDRHRRRVVSTPQPARLVALRANWLIRALCHVKLLQLDEAASALEREFDCDDRLLVTLGAEDLLRSYARSLASTGELLRALREGWEMHAEHRDDLFALASGVLEHGGSKLLRLFLERRGEETRIPLGEADYLPLPPGTAELRYGEVTDADGVPRYVLLARFGEERVFQELGPVQEIRDRISAHLSRWFRPDALRREAADYAREARALSNLVLGGTESWFRGSKAPRRVILLGTGVFGRFPFGALVVEPGDFDRFDEIPYLIRRTAVLHAPNLTTLQRIPAPNEERRVVALLDPALVGPDGRAIPPLAFAGRELEGIRRAHEEVDVLTRERATVGNLLGAIAAGRLGWLHLGCHAVPDPRAANRASLLTATAPGEEPLGVVTVYRTPLTPGCRVVLSACGTASGDVALGEGILGLWRAFLVAGASCVVATLYEVDDRAISHWMARFHEIAATGVPLAEAARRTCLGWLEGSRPRWPRGSSVLDPAHPYLWAAVMCLGNDGGPLPRIAPATTHPSASPPGDRRPGE